MGYNTDLLTGLAEHLDDLGIGTWSVSGAYAADVTGIVLSVIPQSPAAVIVLSAYSVSDDTTLSDSVTGVQIRTRTAGQDPRPTDDLADSIFDALHGATGLVFGGIRVQQMWRQSWSPLGPDENQRHERADNYYLQTWRPSPHRS